MKKNLYSFLFLLAFLYFVVVWTVFVLNVFYVRLTTSFCLLAGTIEVIYDRHPKDRSKFVFYQSLTVIQRPDVIDKNSQILLFLGVKKQPKLKRATRALCIPTRKIWLQVLTH